MADEKKKAGGRLETFRISDMRRPEVRSFTKPQEDAAQAGAASVGFPLVESRLESQTLEEVVDELRPSYGKLEAILDSGNAKEKAAAKKAMAAYESAGDLFEFLFATKAALQTNAADGAAGPSSSPPDSEEG
jgi:hypothetical protein